MARTNFRGTIRKRIYGCSITKQDSNSASSGIINLSNTDNDSTAIFPNLVDIYELNWNNDTKLTESDVINKINGKKVGKILGNSMNICSVLIRNEAFFKDNNGIWNTNLGINSDDTLQIIPYIPDYLPNLDELFMEKEDVIV